MGLPLPQSLVRTGLAKQKEGIKQAVRASLQFILNQNSWYQNHKQDLVILKAKRLIEKVLGVYRGDGREEAGLENGIDRN